ncbi:hypothetical protein [Robertkochia aurantiaca]|uniref:hypothetical protein n=1 Tax=Robertkochia aurantiaca TaxID=2873700 RepID=UPI001CCAC2FA|nr:hypothetical protein [Robertkochia sp. 3YJGBD-33]
MAQDLRDLFKDEDHKERFTMPEGHREEFESRLEQAFPDRNRSSLFMFLKVAAILVVIFGAGFLIYQAGYRSSGGQQQVVGNDQEAAPLKETRITLGDLSPDLNKIENYYVASINMELSQIEVNADTRKLLDGYMNRLTELNDEYERLTQELNDIGPNDQTINALIENLQMRLQLLYRLKEKMNEFKTSKNEQFSQQTI